MHDIVYQFHLIISSDIWTQKYQYLTNQPVKTPARLPIIFSQNLGLKPKGDHKNKKLKILLRALSVQFVEKLSIGEFVADF